MSFFKRLKHQAILTRAEDEGLYQRVLLEIESGFRRDGLWAQALEKAQGDSERAVATYIRLRVQSLRDEIELQRATGLPIPGHQRIASQGTGAPYDGNGHTPLMRAVLTLDLPGVERLLVAGADPSMKDGNWGTSTALDMAK